MAAATGSGPEATQAWTLTGSGKITTVVTLVYHHIIYGHDSVSFIFHIPATSMKMTGSRAGKLKFDWSETFDHEILYRKVLCGAITCDIELNKVTKDFKLSVSGTSQPSVDQATSMISFPAMDIGTSFSFTDKSKFWERIFLAGNEKDDAAQRTVIFVNQKLSGLSINLRNISVFALTNLLFPNSKVMDLEAVYSPGDMLILGNITKTYSSTIPEL